MKLCKDCKYGKKYNFLLGWFDEHKRHPRCEHDVAVISRNFYTGSTHYLWCNTMRRDNDCGSEAKLFEAKSVRK